MLLDKGDRGNIATCEICGEREAEHRCSMCGRLTCNEHWCSDRCETCLITSCQVCGLRLAVGYCMYCGRLVCEECSREEGAARICAECKAREARFNHSNFGVSTR